MAAALRRFLALRLRGRLRSLLASPARLCAPRRALRCEKREVPQRRAGQALHRTTASMGPVSPLLSCGRVPTSWHTASRASIIFDPRFPLSIDRYPNVGSLGPIIFDPLGPIICLKTGIICLNTGIICLNTRIPSLNTRINPINPIIPKTTNITNIHHTGPW